jgi:radical SAM enzyme (TIGR01210 family)
LKKEYIIPIFVPHLGCKKCCTFCNQRTISGEQKQVTSEDVKNTIEYYLKNFKTDKNYVEVAFFGGSFTAIDIEKQKELLNAVQPYIKDKKVNSIRLSTRPDAIDKTILKMLKKYNVKTIELGVQSTNNYILARCKRGHSFEDVIKASKLIRLYGFRLGHQMMVGLPDSTEKDDIQTAKDIIKLKPKMVRIYPVLVIKGTELEEELNKKDFIPLTVGQAVERTKEIVKLFNQKHIQVIRVGLQNTDSITDPSLKESEVIAGPYHPAFGQLVEDAIWYDKIVDEIKKINAKVIKVEIEANSADINNIVGHKKENINKLKDTYALITIVKKNDEIKKGKFKINVLEVA